MPRKFKYKDWSEAAKDKDRFRSLRRQQNLQKQGVPARKKSYFQTRKSGWKHTFDVTEEDYAFMLAVQNGVCAICLRPERVKRAKGTTPKMLSVDHIHGTPKVRGLLCHSCNIALGLFEDDLLLLDAAMRYLRATG